MKVRMRKFLGMLALLGGLAVYILIAMLIGVRLAGSHWALELVFYVVAGIVWVFPVRYLMVWMQRPDPD
jgi:uncharacterized membrane protein